jgi:Pyruvate/2-oxoacid:ferredoxin oxidoreductase delta subunit
MGNSLQQELERHIMGENHVVIARAYGFGDSERLIKILERLLDEVEASILVSVPSDVGTLSASLAISEEKLVPILAGMVSKGVLFKTSTGYRGPNDIIHLHDTTSRNKNSDRLWGRELLDLWMDFDEHELFNQITDMASVMMSPIFRVIPARGSVADGECMLPSEKLEDLLDKVSKIAVVDCACRRIAQKCSRPTEVCLQLNEDAEFAIQQGAGRELTKAEALEVLARASEGGLVTNVQNLEEVCTVICNCCNDCCMFLYPFVKNGDTEKGLSKSRFEARVDASLCSGCQDCVERCPFEAIAMAPAPGSKKLKAAVNPQNCYGCGVCATGCSTGSIKLYEVRPPEHIPS